MRLTETILNRSTTIEVLDRITGSEMNEIFTCLMNTEALFDPYSKDSYISKLNKKTISFEEMPSAVKKVLSLCSDTTNQTMGYFNSKIEKYTDPSGLLKGYMIDMAAEILRKKGYLNFYIEMGSDMYFSGRKSNHKWKIGLHNPLLAESKVKVLHLTDQGIATSGQPQKGNPLYNPVKLRIPKEIETITVIAPNALDADRFATAAFAMGIELGIEFLERINLVAIGFTKKGEEFTTRNFEKLLEA